MNIIFICDLNIISEDIIKNNNDNNLFFIDDLDLSLNELECYFNANEPDIVIYISTKNREKIETLLIITSIKYNIKCMVTYSNNNDRYISNIKSSDLPFKHISIICENYYGECCNFINTNNEIMKLIYNIFLCKKNNDKIQLNLKDKIKGYVYIRDISKIILHIIKYNSYFQKDKKIILDNFSCKILTGNIAKSICNSFGFQNLYSEINQVIDETISDTKFENILLTNYDKGIKNTINFFLNNYPNIQ